jgi:hypothetical protein
MKEGSAYTNFLKLIQEQGYNKDISITVGLVTSISPFKVQLPSGLLLDDEDITITDTANKAIVGDRVLILNDGNNFYAIDKVVN